MKPGYLTLDFIPINNDKLMDSDNTRTFILLPKDIGIILDLDLNLPYTEEIALPS